MRINLHFLLFSSGVNMSTLAEVLNRIRKFRLKEKINTCFAIRRVALLFQLSNWLIAKLKSVKMCLMNRNAADPQIKHNFNVLILLGLME